MELMLKKIILNVFDPYTTETKIQLNKKQNKNTHDVIRHSILFILVSQLIIMNWNKMYLKSLLKI